MRIRRIGKSHGFGWFRNRENTRPMRVVALLSKTLLFCFACSLAANSWPAPSLQDVLDSANGAKNAAVNAKNAANEAKTASQVASTAATTAKQQVDRLTAEGGILDYVTQVNALRDELGPETFETVQNLAKDQLGAFTVLSDYQQTLADTPEMDLIGLLDKIEAVIGATKFFVPNIELPDTTLPRTLITSGPPQLISLAAKAMYASGGEEMAQMLSDTIAPLSDLATALAADNALIQGEQLSTLAAGPSSGRTPLQGATNCQVWDERRRALKAAAVTLQSTSIGLQATAPVVAAFFKIIKTETGAKVWGWVGGDIAIKVHVIPETVGKAGQVIGKIADAGFARLRHCELLYRQEEVFQQQAVLLEEICSLSRYRSAACQALK
ncbi:hypothetical protein EYC98_08360 [Halieaceae bacterium IMCC14734]|uniref:Uncharacterized protein n=1 Tax=Candidatus Litorirhabdus singularis TaxID=2518993 RepID=A0ABT3TEY9_9GAMM|nr:hypothetical protein [Candidatus Litorirhabdus singularis]MCX2980877.1 hypothetical protein [Candidatus Litorirhabdus singularis]